MKQPTLSSSSTAPSSAHTPPRYQYRRFTRGVNASGFFWDCAAHERIIKNATSANTAVTLTLAPP